MTTHTVQNIRAIAPKWFGHIQGMLGGLGARLQAFNYDPKTGSVAAVVGGMNGPQEVPLGVLEVFPPHAEHEEQLGTPMAPIVDVQPNQLPADLQGMIAAAVGQAMAAQPSGKAAGTAKGAREGA